jgi:hypothetical protein
MHPAGAKARNRADGCLSEGGLLNPERIRVNPNGVAAPLTEPARNSKSRATSTDDVGWTALEEEIDFACERFARRHIRCGAGRSLIRTAQLRAGRVGSGRARNRDFWNRQAGE